MLKTPKRLNNAIHVDFDEWDINREIETDSYTIAVVWRIQT